jgi:tetratricopeptide (TPR) repeat protein
MEHFEAAEKLLSKSGKKAQPTKNAKEAIEHIKNGLEVGNRIDPSTGKPKLDDKNRAKAYAMMGDAHSTLGDTGKAIDAYKQATQLDKSRHDYALKLADAYYKKG